MKHTTKFLFLAVLCTGLAACEKPEPGVDPIDSVPVDPRETGHALVLNEGTWGGNNASLSYIDLEAGTLVNDWFGSVNQRGLGDLGQDLLIYGAKAYVTVSESGSLEAIDTSTGLSTHISLGQRYPRYIAADGGKLYVSCYRPHSVVRIDTATLEVEATCTLGDFNPEGMAVAASKLVVASSNVSDEQGTYSYDNKIYVIDLGTFNVDTAIVVGSNPQKIVAIDGTRVAANYIGDYADQPAGTAIVDLSSLTVTQLGHPFTNMTVYSGHLYGYSMEWTSDYSSKTASFMKVETSAPYTATPLLTNLSINPYAIGVHPVSGNIYVASDGNYSSNGELFCFTPEGTQLWKRTVGMLPSKIVFF